MRLLALLVAVLLFASCVKAEEQAEHITEIDQIQTEEEALDSFSQNQEAEAEEVEEVEEEEEEAEEGEEAEEEETEEEEEEEEASGASLVSLSATAASAIKRAELQTEIDAAAEEAAGTAETVSVEASVDSDVSMFAEVLHELSQELGHEIVVGTGAIQEQGSSTETESENNLEAGQVEQELDVDDRAIAKAAAEADSDAAQVVSADEDFDSVTRVNKRSTWVEGSTVTIVCPQKFPQLRIRKARWWRYEQKADVTIYFSAKHCSAPYTPVANSETKHPGSCYLKKVNNEAFGGVDPAPSKEKYLFVVWECTSPDD